MRYGISAGAIVLRGREVLMVHHRGTDAGGEFDFWVMPGGSLEGDESILDCARREAFEETGLEVVPERIVYVEEFAEPDYHFCKFWVLCKEIGGTLSLANENPEEHHVVDVQFFDRSDFPNTPLYPAILNGLFWDDQAVGFLEFRYLGLSKSE